MPAPAMTDRARSGRIVRTLARAHPDARFELDFATPLELLVALILAAQFRDDRVNQITPALFARYRTARDYAEAPTAELEAALREVGFFRQKTKAVQSCMRELVGRFGGEVPRRLDDLLSLPYVGRKTANVLRGNAFGDAAIGVDRHVARLALRIGLSSEQHPDRIEAQLSAVVAPRDQVRFCQLLQWHGRRVCLARTPLCERCVIRPLCDYGRRALGASVAAKERPAATARKPASADGSRAARTKVAAKAEVRDAAARARKGATRAQTGRKSSSAPR